MFFSKSFFSRQWANLNLEEREKRGNPLSCVMLGHEGTLPSSHRHKGAHNSCTALWWLSPFWMSCREVLSWHRAEKVKSKFKAILITLSKSACEIPQMLTVFLQCLSLCVLSWSSSGNGFGR